MHTVSGSARRPAAAFHHASRPRQHAPPAGQTAPRIRVRTLACCLVAVPALLWLMHHVVARLPPVADSGHADTADAPPPIPMGRLEEPAVVDAVFTYVNGSDPVWRAAFDAHLASHPRDRHLQGQGHGKWRPADGADVPFFNRYRDWNELRYSLRSLHMHAPWVRHVYIVVAGPTQVPRWLDAAHPRVRIVYHRDLFPLPELELPTFNSLAIESVLHRIDGLSNHFLYMNNDVFFGRRAHVADFIDARSYRRFIDWSLDSSRHDPCFAVPARHDTPACARIQHMWERRALIDISHRLRQPLAHMRRRNRVRDEATDVSTHVQYEAWLKRRSNIRAPGERRVVDESVTVRDRRSASDAAAADSRRHGSKRTALDAVSAQRGSRLGSALMAKNPRAAGGSPTEPSQALYLYRLFADADIAEAAGGQWYATLDCELSDAGQRPLFVGIDDDLKAASAADMARHRRRFEWLMSRHWSQPAPWELPGRAEVEVDAAEAAQLQCARVG